MVDLSKLTDVQLEALLAQSQQPKPPAAAPEPERGIGDRLSGAAKAVDAGVGAGIAGIAGFPRFAGELAQKALYGATSKANEILGLPEYKPPEGPSFLENWPSTESTQKTIQNQFYAGQPAYEPKDIIERYLKTAGEFSVGGFGGPASARTLLGKGLQKIAQVAAPAAASETAGQAASLLADNSDGEYAKYAEPVARFLGAVVGGGIHGYLTRPDAARNVLERNMPGVTPKNVADADALMQRSREGANPVPLTWSEALSQVRQAPTLTDLQRHLEASKDSAPQMAQFFGQRPQQVEGAVDSATQALSPGSPNPYMIGPRAAAAAGKTINDIRNSITTATRPMYDAAGQHLVPQSVHTAMMADPLFAETVNEIRNNSALNKLVGAASDRSIAMYDAVAKQLEQRSRNAAQPLHQQASQAIAAVTGAMGGDIKDVAIAAERNAAQGPSSYEAALAKQTQLRNEQLDPALAGPTGQLAEAQTTGGAASALFPTGKDVVARGEVQIAQTVRDLAKHDPTAASDLIRNHVETLFNDAASDLTSGPAQTGGAKFRQRVLGNRQEGKNLQAAVENATPDGAERWQGFSKLLDILEATGTRLNVGSRTAYNQEIREAMKSGALPAVAKTAANPLNFFRPLAETFEGWKYGKNLKDLSSILTDPRAAPMLRSIAEENASSWKGARKAMTLLNYINATKAKTDEPTMLPPVTVTPPG